MLGYIVEKMAKHKEKVGSITLGYISRKHRGAIKGSLRIEGRPWTHRKSSDKRMKEVLEIILAK